MLGNWSGLSTGRPWTKYASKQSYATYTNDTGRTVVIKMIKLALSSGKGTVYGSSSGNPPYGQLSGDGSSYNVKLLVGSTEFGSSTVTTSVGVASLGSTDVAGYFHSINSETYAVTFTGRVTVASGSHVTIYVQKEETSTIMVLGPSAIFDQTIVYEGSSGGTLTVPSTVLYNGNPTQINCTWSGARSCQSREVFLNSSVSDWASHYSSPFIVSLNPTTYYAAEFRTVDNIDEFEFSDTKRTTIKLRPPSVNAVSTVTIGNSITPSSSSDFNPSGVSYSYQYSTDGGANAVNLTTTTLAVNNSTTVLRSKAVKSPFIESDYGDWVSVPVRYAPINMSDNGFTYSFNYVKDGVVTSINTDGSTVVPPGSSIRVIVSAFDPSKDLGRFNRCSVSVNDSNDPSFSLTDNWTNDPLTSNSYDIEVLTEWAGKTCSITLSCQCYWNGTVYNSTSTGTFTSPLFKIGGRPYFVLKYPYIESGSSFITNREQPRIIFTVFNPEYLGDEKITDVRIYLYKKDSSGSSSQVGSYTYKNNPEYFYSTSTDKPPTLESGTTLDFIYPSYFLSETFNEYSFALYVDNRYLASETSDRIFINYRQLDYVVEGEIISKESYYKLRSCLLEDAPYYQTYLTSSGVLDLLAKISNLFPLPSEGQDLPAVNRPFVDTAEGFGVISLIKNLYDLVLVDSVPDSPYPLLDFDKINRQDLRDVLIDAEDDPLKFVVEGNYYSPIGNYFNYIVYILKYML